MVDEDSREEWAKYATPNDDWQSAHKKNSITKITKHAAEFSNCVNMLNDLNGINTEDLQTILKSLQDRWEVEKLLDSHVVPEFEISNAIQKTKDMISGIPAYLDGKQTTNDRENEAKLRGVLSILEEISEAIFQRY